MRKGSEIWNLFKYCPFGIAKTVFEQFLHSNIALNDSSLRDMPELLNKQEVTLLHFNFTFSTLIKEKCSKTLINLILSNDDAWNLPQNKRLKTDSRSKIKIFFFDSLRRNRNSGHEIDVLLVMVCSDSHMAKSLSQYSAIKVRCLLTKVW